MDVQIPRNAELPKCSNDPFSIELPLHFCEKSISRIYVGLYLILHSVPTVLCFYSFDSLLDDYLSWLLLFYSKKISYYESSNFFFFQMAFAILVSLPFHIHLRIILSTTIKFCCDFDRKYTNIYHFRDNWHLYCVESSNPWTLCVDLFISPFFHQSFVVSSIQVLYLLDLYPIILFSRDGKWYCIFNFSIHMFIAGI